MFVMQQTVDMQMDPNPDKLKSLIDINCNIAAGLAGTRLSAPAAQGAKALTSTPALQALYNKPFESGLEVGGDRRVGSPLVRSSVWK